MLYINVFALFQKIQLELKSKHIWAVCVNDRAKALSLCIFEKNNEIKDSFLDS